MRLTWGCAITCTASTAQARRRSPIAGWLIGSLIAAGALGIGSAGAADDQPLADDLARGADLFAKEWLPEDSKHAGADGLGPVYNEASCVACHFQGGPGGAGPTSANVEILSISRRSKTGAAAESHPGFKNSRSVVLHRYGIDPMYKSWRLRLLGDERLADMVESVDTEIKQVQQLVVGTSSARAQTGSGFPQRNGMSLSRRNPPALFGAGLIDALPNEVLIAAEKRKFPEFPEIHGRANHLKDDQIGRFGWKAETPSLREFVLSACANELGLEVPGHHQAPSPLDPEAKAKGLDLTQDQCDALVAYVRNLSGLSGTRRAGSRESEAVDKGRSLFEAAGCATCHQSRLGNIEGIYSDLLLHDMGPALGDSGNYKRVTEPDSSTDGQKMGEWRTPPLWGFRDSGPYLHDGRAANLEEVVALHGGQSAKSAQRFFKLLHEERLRVQTFLRSLTPPAVPVR
jgi:CxxC motif-containing protein (DUF1111 family)